MKSIDNLLWFLRVHNGLTQTELSKKTGLTINDISRLEKGNPGMRIEKTIVISQYFNVSVDALVDNDFEIIISAFKNPPVVCRKMQGRIKSRRRLCDRIGVEGEDWVFKQEMKKLAGTIYANAVNPNYADDAEAHFDILSFDCITRERIVIEVKSTSGEQNEPFHITAQELEMARECLANGVRYELHRVYYVEDVKRRGRIIYSANELLHKFSFKEYDYVAKLKEASL